jgi:3'(2'),5'-bisphosphate nucleotidase
MAESHFAFTREHMGLLCSIAQRAGREVMAVYDAPFAASAKQDGSPVTEADLRADRVIREGLATGFPGVCIVSEESSPDMQDAADCFFLVDPLDGTREFVARNGEFTVNIAAIARGQPVAGVVLAPATGEMFYAARGVGAWRQTPQGEHALRVRPARAGEALRVLGSRSHQDSATRDWLAALSQPWTMKVAGSSLKFCRIAAGDADLYPRLGPTCQWDTAAGHAVLEQAGGAVRAASGSALAYGRDRPLINPYFVALADPSLTLPPLPPPALCGTI